MLRFICPGYKLVYPVCVLISVSPLTLFVVRKHVALLLQTHWKVKCLWLSYRDLRNELLQGVPLTILAIKEMTATLLQAKESSRANGDFICFLAFHLSKTK